MSNGNTIDFFYLKDPIKSHSITVSCISLAVIGIIIYSYISLWGVPESFNEVWEMIGFSGFIAAEFVALIAALLAIICSVISYFTRKDCYIEFTETVLYGKLPAFPLRTKEVEIPYSEIIGIKRSDISRNGSFNALIVKTENGRILIPHNNNVKIRKIENLLYDLKG